jgi:hypothetical protein
MINYSFKLNLIFLFKKIAFGMESNTLNDQDSKLNTYVTESFKGFFSISFVQN